MTGSVTNTLCWQAPFHLKKKTIKMIFTNDLHKQRVQNSGFILAMDNLLAKRTVVRFNN